MSPPENHPMIARRRLLLGAAATLLCAPSIVRAPSLMVLRGIQLPRDQHQGYGYLERVFVDSFAFRFMQLQGMGLSANEVAAQMNSASHLGINWQPWDGQLVLSLLAQKRKIERADAVRRKKELTA